MPELRASLADDVGSTNETQTPEQARRSRDETLLEEQNKAINPFVLPIYNPREDPQILTYDPPVPFDARVPQQMYKFVKEPWDLLIPANGFLSDFILATRDRETTAQISYFSCLSILSSIAKRYVWIKEGEGKLLANLFMTIVAPPARIRKSTAVDYATEILYRLQPYVRNETLRVARLPNFFQIATSEALMTYMKPQEIRKKLDDGQIKVYNGGSNGAMILRELTAAVNRSSYNEAIVQTLCDLYDGNPRGFSRVTLKHKKQSLNNIYFTFFAATTPEEFIKNTPANFVTGGLASRMIIVSEKERFRRFDWPTKLEGLPSMDDLAQRLAWIIDHAYGEYRVTNEAMERYSAWRTEHEAKMDHLPPVEQKFSARKDIMVKQVALLLRMQEYRMGREIGLQNMNDAIKAIDAVYEGGRVHAEITQTQATYYFRERVETVFKNHPHVPRKVLQQRLSRYVSARDLEDVLSGLLIEGRIWIEDEKGHPIYTIRPFGTDIYHWIDINDPKVQGHYAIAELARNIATMENEERRNLVAREDYH